MQRPRIDFGCDTRHLRVNHHPAHGGIGKINKLVSSVPPPPHAFWRGRGGGDGGARKRLLEREGGGGSSDVKKQPLSLGDYFDVKV